MEKRKLASVQYVHRITPIEGADRIECVRIIKVVEGLPNLLRVFREGLA